MRGADMKSDLDSTDQYDDYWSGAALVNSPRVVTRLHADYIAAGADVITADTFRINGPTLRRLRRSETVEELVALAVSLVRNASPIVPVAGSVGPLSLRGTRAARASDISLRNEHGRTMRALVQAGADLLLPETIGSVQEARAIMALAVDLQLPCWLSFALSRDGLLPSGERLSSAVEAILPYEPEVLLVNHCVPAVVPDALARMAAVLAGTPVLFGVRPHLLPSSTAARVEPMDLVDATHRWLDLGASVVGGCCGTDPRHITALAGLRRSRILERLKMKG
jgi:S-methylmethionine-dependent homocysteine/selenocysteine methylase